MRESQIWDRETGAYANYLVAAGRSKKTVQLRCKYLSRLARRFPLSGPYDLTADDLMAFMAHGDWEPETRKSARSSLRGFYEWAVLTERTTTDPARFLPPVRVPATMPRPTPDAVLLAALEGASDRERLMILLAAHAGLRRGEIAGLHSGDVLEDRLRIKGKGGKIREIPLHPLLAEALLARPEGFIFPGKDEGHLSAQWVGDILTRLLGPGWTAHTLRHRFASRAYAGERDVFSVQKLLGHAKPETTMRYVAVTDQSLTAAVLAT